MELLNFFLVSGVAIYIVASTFFMVSLTFFIDKISYLF
jgi:hypothetical protein